jgi:long-chain acyl-CoA synthetase
VSRPVTVEVLTAADAEVAQRRAAGALRQRGLGPGDRVAFCLPSSAALLCAVLGAVRTGVVPVLLNATLTDGERAALVADADPGLVIDHPGRLAELVAGPTMDVHPYPLTRPMHYTSGTTGRSKGVWSGIWDAATAETAFADEADLWAFAADDVHLVCSPMYHSVSIRFAGGTLLRGGTVVVLDRFDAGVARQALVGRYGPVPTTTFMAPSSLGRLLGVPSDEPGGGAARPSDRFDALRLLVHAGSACPPAVKREAMARTRPGAVWEFYGSTEGQFTVCSPREWMDRPGTVGRARPGRTLAVDPGGTIWCSPPPFARFAYWRDPDKTDRAWREGAFTVGDLGRLDDQGYLFIDGRRDDLIISGGVNVYPAEVEAVLGEVPGVAEVAVFGLSDDRWGQRVCAALVLAPPGPEVRERGATYSDQLIGSVRTRATEQLAGYKRPKQYVVLEALPHTATGKVMRGSIAGLLPPG